MLGTPQVRLEGTGIGRRRESTLQTADALLELCAIYHTLLADAEDTTLFLMLHYPLRGRRGEPYGPSTRANACSRNNFCSPSALISVFRQIRLTDGVSWQA